MKKTLFIIIAAFCFNLATTAQESTGLTWDMVISAAEKSDKNIVNEKKNLKASTWKKCYVDYWDLYRFDLNLISPGFESNLIVGAMKKSPLNQKIENGYEIMTFDRIKYYIKQGKVESWERVNFPKEKPLLTAVMAAEKAFELDASVKIDTLELQNLKYYCNLEANFAYSKDDYKTSFEYFEGMQRVQKLLGTVHKPFGLIDTAAIRNCGIVAKQAKMYDEAMKYFNMSAELENNADFIAEIGNILKLQGDTAKAVSVLKEGVEKYPSTSEGILVQIINIYIEQKKLGEALDYINLAIQNNPSNATYYFAKGVALDNDGKPNEALEVYLKGLELDPENEDINFNIAVVYRALAQKKYDQANEEKSDKLYKQYKAEADGFMKSSIPYLEKVLELIETGKVKLSKENAMVYDALKETYFKLNMMDKYKEIKDKIAQVKESMK